MLYQPKISVIVLIYNVEQYIDKCIESLYNQSLDSIEYIFVDDCSTDNSIERLKRIMSEYPLRAKNSIIISNKCNQGQAKSRITGIGHAHGKYVIACDSDDYIATNAYEDLYNFIESTQSDIVSCNFYRVHNGIKFKETYNGTDSPHDWIKNIFLSKKMGSLCNHLIRRQLLKRLIVPEANIMEDTVILIQSLLNAKTVSSYPDYLYYYVFRDNSISNSSDNILAQAESMYANMNIISDLLKDHQPSLDKEIECELFFIKKWLFPLISNVKECRNWINFHTEVNKKIIPNPYIKFTDKIKVLFIYLRFYPYIKNLRKLI